MRRSEAISGIAVLLALALLGAVAVVVASGYTPDDLAAVLRSSWGVIKALGA